MGNKASPMSSCPSITRHFVRLSSNCPAVIANLRPRTVYWMPLAGCTAFIPVALSAPLPAKSRSTAACRWRWLVHHSATVCDPHEASCMHIPRRISQCMVASSPSLWLRPQRPSACRIMRIGISPRLCVFHFTKNTKASVGVSLQMQVTVPNILQPRATFFV